jgi:hypothetical protein
MANKRFMAAPAGKLLSHAANITHAS